MDIGVAAVMIFTERKKRKKKEEPIRIQCTKKSKKGTNENIQEWKKKNYAAVRIDSTRSMCTYIVHTCTTYM